MIKPRNGAPTRGIGARVLCFYMLGDDRRRKKAVNWRQKMGAAVFAEVTKRGGLDAMIPTSRLRDDCFDGLEMYGEVVMVRLRPRMRKLIGDTLGMKKEDAEGILAGVEKGEMRIGYSGGSQRKRKRKEERDGCSDNLEMHVEVMTVLLRPRMRKLIVSRVAYEIVRYGYGYITPMVKAQPLVVPSSDTSDNTSPIELKDKDPMHMNM
uniref:Uncharacterized protein n=1 Tax=Oryza punctata TaxID=4537 RepID=A0A0E0KZH8_ORYPU